MYRLFSADSSSNQVASYFFIVDEDLLSSDSLAYDVTITSLSVPTGSTTTFSARRTPQRNWFELVATPALDFESHRQHLLLVTISDPRHDDWSLQQRVILNVMNVFEAPLNVTLRGANIDENSPPNSLIGWQLHLRSLRCVT